MRLGRLAYVTSVSTAEDFDYQVADLTAQLAAATQRAHAAEERAHIAETQLRRVHAAVRAFKERQLTAQHAAAAAAFQTTTQANPPDRSWAVEDPTLDSRFQHFLDGEGDDDAARKWILDQT